MEDKLILINQFLDNQSKFNIPLKRKKLLYYSIEQPQNVGISLSFSITADIMLNNNPLTDKILKEEIEKHKKENVSDDEIFKRIKEKLEINVNCDKNLTEEPSTIYLSLPITKPNSASRVDAFDYYPCYAHLTPEQRWIYLEWLQDITKSVPKAFVYIYYYGLERQLLNKNNLEAVDELLYLAQHHDFIRRDAFTTILFAYLRNENIEILKKLSDMKLDYPISNINLIVYYERNKSLSSKEIFEIISQYREINKRYINLKPQMYLQELDRYLIENYAGQGFPFYKYFQLNEIPLERTEIFLNYSLPDEIRYAEVYNIIEYHKFRNDVLNMHLKIHEKVKQRIKTEKHNIKKV